MRSQRIPMTWDEFEALPRRPGWKHEYVDGTAYITPGHTIVTVSLPLAPREVAAPCALRPVEETDAPALIALFEEAFTETVEYCDWRPAQIRDSARECIEGFFRGRRGKPPHPGSRIGDDADGPAGAALISATPDGPLLDVLFIRPAWQRRGLGTALVASAVSALHAAGETKLFSRCHLGNEASVAWHRRFGFVEEPDLTLTEMRLRLARHELHRRQKPGGLSAEERSALEAECARLKKQVATLEEVKRRDGYEAVCPTLRCHW